MKKTYINPTIKVVTIQTARFLASSEQVRVGDNYNGTATIESRQGSGFDWDEDEEE